ncbi:MAG TPA: hypothetical protein VGL91_19695, partial [Acidobacteriota bacterium]
MIRISRLLLTLALLSALFCLIQFRVGRSGAAGGAAPQPPVQAVRLQPEDEISFRILLGLTDAKATKWDGSISIKEGKIVRLEPWRFDEGDSLSDHDWKISTHPARAFGGGQQQQQQRQERRRQRQQERPASQQPQSSQAQQQPQQPSQPQTTPPAPPQPQPVVANGVVATFQNTNFKSQVKVKTAQGNFEFRPADFPYGKAGKFLDGRVMVDRVPAVAQLTRSRDDQDYPAAAADRDGNVWVAFLQFKINSKFGGVRMALKEAPKNFDELAEPAGGDQILLLRYSRGAWSAPVAISDAGGDLYKPAVAVDGPGRAWVFWSANKSGNFDLYARSFDGQALGKTLRLTRDRGPDIVPVAATDAQGRVWVAWQAFRNGRFQIHAARQQQDSFSEEIAVGSSAGNEWDPAIAAAPGGEISVAWDSYRNGNYDVFFRSLDANGVPGPERIAAATARYEAYPSVAYDPSGRLWIAWEESDQGWGKDFGAYETTGIGLYHGRWIRLKVWEGERAFSPGNVDAVLPGVPDRKVDSTARQSDANKEAQPDPALATNRKAGAIPQIPARPKNSLPRLLADRSGRVWLAYRTAQPTWWTAIGTVWFENVVAFDGESWSNPIFLMHSDNLLDNRPALTSTAAGELMIVDSSDGRQKFYAGLRRADIPGQQFALEQDPYNNDLYATRISLPEPVKPAKLEAAPSEESIKGNSPDGRSGGSDTSNVRRLRDYRARFEGVEYRILRGEFHRHTEVSMDGGRDGTMWDTWRYALDAAALDWIGCCDHDNGFGREYTWWVNQKLTDMFLLPGIFTPMFSYERSVAYPEGHRNVIFTRRGVRTLPRLPKVKDDTVPGSAPDTKMLYGYLRHFDGIVASHTSATNMGTDWRDNDP